MSKKLTAAQRKTALSGLKGWKPVDGRDAIAKSFKFADFNAAFGFGQTQDEQREQVRDPPDVRHLERESCDNRCNG